MRGQLEVRDLDAAELSAAVAVLARGMRDNPVHVQAYGDDPNRRRRLHGALMRGVLGVFDHRDLICATLDGRLVGVAAATEPGACQPTTMQRLRLLPTVAGMGPRTSLRVLAWTSAWARRDPSWPHVHFGPFAVDDGFQGQGIGSAIMSEFCRRLDQTRAASYLETDKSRNVDFYQRFGFEVTRQQPVLGVPTWYMARSST